MNARQFVPFHRLAEMFRYVFNTPISEGALVKAINRVAEKAIPAFCLAHLLREFNHVSECYKLKWATDFKQLLVETIAFKKTLLPQDYHKTLIQRTQFEERLDKLLIEPIKKKHPIAISLQNRLVKYRQHIFTFLYYPSPSG